MPKQKTVRSVKKRFRYTGKGKLRRYKAYKSHILTKKNAKRKRRLRQPDLVDSVDQKRIKKLLPYG